MLSQPRKTKYRRSFRPKVGGKAYRGSKIAFGDWGLKVIKPGWITARQLESARKAIVHHTKRQGKLWIRVFPHFPITSRAAGAHMGGGKGDLDHYVANVKAGAMIFELAGLTDEVMLKALKAAAAKFSLPTKIAKEE